MIHNIIFRHGRFFLLKNKFWEIQLFRSEDWNHYFNFHFQWTRKMDHAGFTFEVDILSFGFLFTVYDRRHWNHDKDQWEPASGYGRTYTELDL